MATKTELIIGAFIVVLAIGVTYTLNPPEGYDTYDCDGIVGYCFKLSKVNDNGIQRNCYYNQSAPKKHKICSTGWESYNGENVTGEITDLPDHIEVNLNISNKELYDKRNSFDKCIRFEKEVCKFFFNKEEYLFLYYSNGTLKPKEVLRQEREKLLTDSINEIISDKQRDIENEQYIGEEVLEAGEVMLS